MIEFKPIRIEDRAQYEAYLFGDTVRGCEYSFSNLYLWGRQNAAVIHDHLVLFSHFDRRSVYPFPVGKGDKKAVLDAIIADAKERGISCRITGLGEDEMELIESLYPDQFRFHCDRAFYDYVYAIDDLADLKGKKYHRKRNHLKRFQNAFPEYHAVPLSEENLSAVACMIEAWYADKMRENPDSDFQMEQIAISKALRRYRELGMEGLVLFDGDNLLAVTLGSRLSFDTFDVHFEKARTDVDGAYAAINCEFARYIRSKYPEIRFLNREDDMGLEGLRKAKESYYPHHLVKKCWACLLEDGYEY